MQRINYCEIDLDAIRQNVRVMRAAIHGGARLLAVVKADAYGHGAVPVAKAALSAGAQMLAVAIPEEGIELRAAGIDAPILVLGGIDESAAEAVVSAERAKAEKLEGLLRQLAESEERMRNLQ